MMAECRSVPPPCYNHGTPCEEGKTLKCKGVIKRRKWLGDSILLTTEESGECSNTRCIFIAMTPVCGRPM